jgi:hypothetical protein
MFVLLMALLFSLSAIPAAAQLVECVGIVYFQPEGGDDVGNDGTRERPFKTQEKAFEVLRALNGNCAIELDELGEQVAVHVRAVPPVTGVPLASEALYALIVAGALLLFGAGWWLRRKGVVTASA